MERRPHVIAARTELAALTPQRSHRLNTHLSLEPLNERAAALREELAVAKLEPLPVEEEPDDADL